MRAALRDLAGDNWHTATLAWAVAVLMVLTVVALIAVAGLATVAVADQKPAIQVAVFVVVTLATSALLAFLGRRPWVYVLGVLRWKREPPPGTTAVHLHVHVDDQDRARWILLDLGFVFVEQNPAIRPPPRGEFPTKCITAWSKPGERGAATSTDAYWKLREAGIRVRSIVGGTPYTR